MPKAAGSAPGMLNTSPAVREPLAAHRSDAFDKARKVLEIADNVTFARHRVSILNVGKDLLFASVLVHAIERRIDGRDPLGMCAGYQAVDHQAPDAAANGDDRCIELVEQSSGRRPEPLRKNIIKGFCPSRHCCLRKSRGSGDLTRDSYQGISVLVDQVTFETVVTDPGEQRRLVFEVPYASVAWSENSSSTEATARDGRLRRPLHLLARPSDAAGPCHPGVGGDRGAGPTIRS
jgi:hypothetical protein